MEDLPYIITRLLFLLSATVAVIGKLSSLLRLSRGHRLAVFSQRTGASVLGEANFAVYFHFCHMCESDYRLLSQYLASADAIVVGKFIFPGPADICCQC